MARRRGLGPGSDRIKQELDRISEAMRSGQPLTPEEDRRTNTLRESLFGRVKDTIQEIGGSFDVDITEGYEEEDSYQQEVDRRREARRRFEAMTLTELCLRCGITPDVFKPVAVVEVPYEMRPPYVGPYNSSRLIEHRFVPEEGYRDVMVNALVNGEIPPEPDGYILVEWVKAGKNGKKSMYGPHSLSEYRTFNNEPSKGQAVVKLDNHQYGWNIEYMAWAAV